MRRMMFAALVYALAAGVPAVAQDRQPDRPPAQPRPAAPAPRVGQLEEEVELLEAERDVKKAHVRAAEIGVKAAAVGAERLHKLAERGTVSADEVERAKLEVEMAKVQVEIRLAELRAVEVRVKFAKKRLEEAKAAGTRPAPAERPAPGERPGRPEEPRPTNMLRSGSLRLKPPSTDELKIRLAKAQAELADQAELLRRAQAEVKAAEDELAALIGPPEVGVRVGETQPTELKWARAARRLHEIEQTHRSLQLTVDVLQRRQAPAEKEKP